VTFNRGYHVAKPGQVVEVAGGTYAPQTIFSDSTKAAPNVVIRAAKGATVNIVAPAGGIAIFLGANSDEPAARGPSYLTISGVHALGGLHQWSGSTRNPLPIRSFTLRDSSFSDVRSRLGPLITFTYIYDLKVLNNDIGPVCCGTDGLNLANAGGPGTDPTNVLIDHNYIHDITRDCSTNPDPTCANTNNCPANTAICDHSDGSQFFGVKTLMMSNNRYYNAGVQNIFLQSANGGVFSNLTFVNNMVATTAGNGVTNSVSLGGPGRGLFSGYIRFVNNTFQRGLLIYDSLPRGQVVAPGTKIVLAGNIFGYVGNDTGAPRCTVVASDGTEIQPVYSHNLNGNKQCSSSDRRGEARFISTDPLHPDLHLLRGSPGIGEGDKRETTRLDIDGQLRPVQSAPDIGADQREPAGIERSRGLGAIRLGEQESDVVDFYGAPRSQKVLRIGEGEVRLAAYRLHRGMVWIAYAGGKVVGVGTSSAFYELGQIHVGSTLGSARSLGELRWSACRKAYANGGGQNRVYVALVGGDKRGKVGNIWLLGKTTPECWTRPR
jgi:hypothetical protein